MINFCDIKREDDRIMLRSECIYEHFELLEAICGHVSPGAVSLCCTRPSGHEGVHCGCGTQTHVLGEWANFGKIAVK